MGGINCNTSDKNLEVGESLKKIFGTDNEEELKIIALKAQRYDEMFQNRCPVNIRKAGRKARFSEADIASMESMIRNGYRVQDIAVHFNTTRQTISKYIAPDRRISRNSSITMRMHFMHENTLCTTIDIDFMNQKIYIRNYTEDIIHRAFGVVTGPTWEDFERFLEERCFPRARANIKDILRDIGVPAYDPLQIIEKTEGRMAEDKQWIKITCLSGRED